MRNVAHAQRTRPRTRSPFTSVPYVLRSSSTDGPPSSLASVQCCGRCRARGNHQRAAPVRHREPIVSGSRRIVQARPCSTTWVGRSWTAPPPPQWPQATGRRAAARVAAARARPRPGHVATCARSQGAERRSATRESRHFTSRSSARPLAESGNPTADATAAGAAGRPPAGPAAARARDRRRSARCGMNSRAPSSTECVTPPAWISIVTVGASQVSQATPAGCPTAAARWPPRAGVEARLAHDAAATRSSHAAAARASRAAASIVARAAHSPP